jgi:DNA polymerase III epsilon subunit-like protein
MSKNADSQDAERQAYIMVDVETAGPNPGNYALLSIGACTMLEPRQTFYIELQPDKDAIDENAMAVHGLDLARLRREGLPPAEGLALFDSWVKGVVSAPLKPVFVAFNAPFDWMFVNDYFHRYLGRNPFGHNALDIRTFYMAVKRLPWSEASMRSASQTYLESSQPLSHHALQDALDQAIIFSRLLSEEATHRAAGG